MWPQMDINCAQNAWFLPWARASNASSPSAWLGFLFRNVQWLHLTGAGKKIKITASILVCLPGPSGGGLGVQIACHPAGVWHKCRRLNLGCPDGLGQKIIHWDWALCLFHYSFCKANPVVYLYNFHCAWNIKTCFSHPSPSACQKSLKKHTIWAHVMLELLWPLPVSSIPCVSHLGLEVVCIPLN